MRNRTRSALSVAGGLSLFAAALVASLGVTSTPTAAQQPGQAPPPAQVAVAALETRRVTPQQSFPGSVVSRADARVATEVAGRAEWVAEVGTAVAAGAPLARLDTRDRQLELEALEADVARLEARLRYQSQQLERFQQLRARDNATAQRLDEATADRDVAAAELTAARARVARARHALQRAEVRAPFAGVVAERMLEPGEYAQPGTEAVRLVATAEVEVVVRAPIRYAQAVAPGQSVAVAIDGRAAQPLPVRAVIPVGDERSRTVELRIPLDGAGAGIGAPAGVFVPEGAPVEAVVVPRDALVLRADGTYVFRLTGDGTVQRLRVTPGVEAEPSLVTVEVADGLTLAAGDRVVIRGAERLTPGAAVTVQE